MSSPELILRISRNRYYSFFISKNFKHTFEPKNRHFQNSSTTAVAESTVSLAISQVDAAELFDDNSTTPIDNRKLTIQQTVSNWIPAGSSKYYCTFPWVRQSHRLFISMFIYLFQSLNKIRYATPWATVRSLGQVKDALHALLEISLLCMEEERNHGLCNTNDF